MLQWHDNTCIRTWKHAQIQKYLHDIIIYYLEVTCVCMLGAKIHKDKQSYIMNHIANKIHTYVAKCAVV